MKLGMKLGVKPLIFLAMIVAWFGMCLLFYCVRIALHFREHTVNAIYVQQEKLAAYHVDFYFGNMLLPFCVFIVFALPLFILAVLTLKD